MWIINGLTVANVDPRTCRYTCPPQRMPLSPVPGVRHYATGLAYVDSGAINTPGVSPSWLFVSYSSNYIARIDVKRCSIAPKSCRISVPTGGVIAGLASDDVAGRTPTPG